MKHEDQVRQGEKLPSYLDEKTTATAEGLYANPVSDYMTHDFTGVPILLVRRQDGTLGAVVNVYRHRGARVAEGSGNAGVFRRPHHAWTYGMGGPRKPRNTGTRTSSCPWQRSSMRIPNGCEQLEPSRSVS